MKNNGKIDAKPDVKKDVPKNVKKFTSGLHFGGPNAHLRRQGQPSPWALLALFLHFWTFQWVFLGKATQGTPKDFPRAPWARFWVSLGIDFGQFWDAFLIVCAEMHFL